MLDNFLIALAEQFKDFMLIFSTSSTNDANVLSVSGAIIYAASARAASSLILVWVSSIEETGIEESAKMGGFNFAIRESSIVVT